LRVDGQKPLLRVDAGSAEMGNNEQVLGFRHPVGQRLRWQFEASDAACRVHLYGRRHREIAPASARAAR
jgi:hypothetical protein